MNSQLEKLQQALAAVVADISEAELAWHPPEKWCVDEVLEHLYLTYTGTLKGFERVIKAHALQCLFVSVARPLFGHKLLSLAFNLSLPAFPDSWPNRARLRD